MKLIRKLLAGSFILGGFIALSILLHAQEAEVPAIQVAPLSLKPTDLQTLNSLSEAQVTAFVSALDATPTISADTLPRSGTYWSLANPTWPPLPGNFHGFSVWEMDGGNSYLLNDVDFDYNAEIQSFASRGGMQMMSLSGPPGFDDIDTNGIGTNIYSYSSFTVADYGTNLWITLVSVTNGYLAAVGTNTLADVQYEIQSRTNLAQSDWHSEGFIFGSETNNWTPLSVAQGGRTNLFIRLRSWADDGSGLPIWWQLEYFGTNGVDPYANPVGDGWNNLQKFQNGMNPNTFYTPPSPQNLTLHIDGTGTNVTLAWQSGGGNVSQYKVELVGYWEGHTTNYVSASQTSAALSLKQSYFGSQFLTPTFQVTAQFPSGAASAPATVGLSSLFASPGQFVHNAQGQYELQMGVLPLGATVIRLFWETNYDFDLTGAYYDVPVSNLVNGSFVLPESVMAGYPIDFTTLVAIQSKSGQFDWEGDFGASSSGGQLVTAGLVTTNDWQTWINASARVVKDNLIFLLRGATVNHSFSYESTYEPPDAFYPGETLRRSETGSAYEYSGYRYYDPYMDELEVEKYHSAAENYLWRNYADFGGSFIAGASYNYSTGKRTFDGPESVIQSSNLPPYAIPSSLLANDTASYYFYRFSADPAYEPDAYGEVGLTISGTNVFLPTGMRNIYGLPVLSVMGDDSVELVAGGASSPLDSFDNTLYWYVQTAFPSLSTAGYYFASQTPHDAFSSPLPPVPGKSGFSPTNTPPFLITGIGQNFNVMGWAKEAIVNGYTGKFAYLEQFFDRAYQVNTNGDVTANSAGPLSSYGDFFATKPGRAALMTMPDIDTGQRGTCMVYCVSLQLDKNHDGNMDLSFNGADATSSSQPNQIWVNNNFDRGHSVDGSDFEQDDLGPVDIANGHLFPDCQYTNGAAAISCTRDLEDYFRLWTPGLSAVMAAMPTNYSVQMALSGSGQIRIFKAFEASGGTNYLFDAATASNQVANSTALYVGLLTSSSPIILNNRTNEHFIFCGVTNGSAQVDLQILDGNQNVVADAPAYLQINDIKQMYERWTVGDDANKTPMSVAVKATDGLQTNPPVTAFQYTPPQNTNTPYILFVHGWNQEAWEKDRYAETAFKRLYWQGYQGRFGIYRWPTGNKFEASFADILTDARNYDNSERNAWLSATGLTNLLTNLKAEYSTNVYLMAHSMGNVVAGEALRRANGQLVNTYVAMQGAVPAHTYDPNATTRVLGLLGAYDSGTPNRYANYYTNGAPPYFNGSAGAGAYVNFYNTNDYALDKWQIDQNYKPDNGTAPGYHYDSGSDVFYKIIGTGPGSTTYLGFPTNTYEIFAYGDEARCYALGAEAGITTFNRNLDLQSIWPPDNSTTDPSKKYSVHKWHSAEFRSDNPSEALYWNNILGNIGFKLK